MYNCHYASLLRRIQKLMVLCVCVCVCVCVRACVCVCLCLCLCLRPFTVKASSVWISSVVREQINDVMLKWSISYTKSLHRYFRMRHLSFLTSHVIPSHTGSRQSYNLTSVRLAFRTCSFIYH